MSFGRHAYRHAIQPSSSSLIDHVWISDEFLASTFRRFAKGQRRHGSQVPGPLEARRRLAKRRNTALAGIAGPGPMEDISGLFGRNGREHMKWTDGGMRMAAPPGQGSDVYQSTTTQSANPVPFYNENFGPSEYGARPGWPLATGREEAASRELNLEEYLETCHTVADVKEAVVQFDIDLRREPEYSRLICEHLLSRAPHSKSASQELAGFLDDLCLNTRGAGNYITTVEYMVSHGMDMTRRSAPLEAIIRALELGLIPPGELLDIIKTLPGTSGENQLVDKRSARFVTRFYRKMWTAIGRCDVYRHNDLDVDILDAWLGVLVERSTSDDLNLAKEIVLGSRYRDLASCSWAPRLIARWLEVSPRFRPRADEDYVKNLLGSFAPDVGSHHLICVTETLVTSEMNHLLESWMDCLSKLQDAATLVSSKVWTDVDLKDSTTQPDSSALSPQHRIILRLWALRTIGRSLPEGPLWRRAPRATDTPILILMDIFADCAEKSKTKDFLSSMVKTIHDLRIPFNGLLMLAADLRMGRSMTKTTRQTLERLERTKVSFSDVFADVQSYDKMSPHLFSTFETMIRQIDVTSPAFIDYGVQIARTGDSQAVWTLIRLLRSHTPLKIAISQSWQRIPHSSEKALVPYYPEPRNAGCPDPHAALEVIHLLATSIACSKQISHRRSFTLLHWLYTFLMRHNAPVKPVIVRAIYHAGVVRFRRAGLRIAQTQYNYIFELLQEFEDPETVETLMNPLQVGRSHTGPVRDWDEDEMY